MSKFTPGPYHTEGAIIYAGTIPLAIVSGLGMADNGPLFSAAPDMYEALKAFVDDWVELNGKVRGSTLDKIDSALAKADGK